MRLAGPEARRRAVLLVYPCRTVELSVGGAVDPSDASSAGHDASLPGQFLRCLIVDEV